MAAAYALRLETYKNFATLDELRQSSEFEPGAAARNRIEAANEKMKTLFLWLLAVVQHRPDLRPDAVPEGLRTASVRFRETLAALLDELSTAVADKAEYRVDDLKTSLVDLEQTTNRDINNTQDVAIATQIRERLVLYQEASSVAFALARLQTRATRK
jgi:hypothetical protein